VVQVLKIAAMFSKAIALGADGVLLASGVVKAADKEKVLRDLSRRFIKNIFLFFKVIIKLNRLI